MQGDDRSMAGLETPEGVVEQLTVGKGAGHVGHTRRVERAQLDLDHAPSPAADEVETGIDDQAVNPGVEPIRVTQPGQVPPGTDQGLLDRVARELRVAEDQPGCRVQPREPHVEQQREGVMIALPCPLDECSLVHSRLDCGTTWAVVLDSVWRRGRRNRSLRVAAAVSGGGSGSR